MRVLGPFARFLHVAVVGDGVLPHVGGVAVAVVVVADDDGEERDDAEAEAACGDDTSGAPYCTVTDSDGASYAADDDEALWNYLWPHCAASDSVDSASCC